MNSQAQRFLTENKIHAKIRMYFEARHMNSIACIRNHVENEEGYKALRRIYDPRYVEQLRAALDKERAAKLRRMEEGKMQAVHKSNHIVELPASCFGISLNFFQGRGSSHIFVSTPNPAPQRMTFLREFDLPRVQSVVTQQPPPPQPPITRQLARDDIRRCNEQSTSQREQDRNAQYPDSSYERRGSVNPGRSRAQQQTNTSVVECSARPSQLVAPATTQASKPRRPSPLQGSLYQASRQELLMERRAQPNQPQQQQQQQPRPERVESKSVPQTTTNPAHGTTSQEPTRPLPSSSAESSHQIERQNFSTEKSAKSNRPEPLQASSTTKRTETTKMLDIIPSAEEEARFNRLIVCAAAQAHRSPLPPPPPPAAAPALVSTAAQGNRTEPSPEKIVKPIQPPQGQPKSIPVIPAAELKSVPVAAGLTTTRPISAPRLRGAAHSSTTNQQDPLNFIRSLPIPRPREVGEYCRIYHLTEHPEVMRFFEIREWTTLEKIREDSAAFWSSRKYAEKFKVVPERLLENFMRDLDAILTILREEDRDKDKNRVSPHQEPSAPHRPAPLRRVPPPRASNRESYQQPEAKAINVIPPLPPSPSPSLPSSCSSPATYHTADEHEREEEEGVQVAFSILPLAQSNPQSFPVPVLAYQPQLEPEANRPPSTHQRQPEFQSDTNDEDIEEDDDSDEDEDEDKGEEAEMKTDLQDQSLAQEQARERARPTSPEPVDQRPAEANNLPIPMPTTAEGGTDGPDLADDLCDLLQEYQLHSPHVHRLLRGAGCYTVKDLLAAPINQLQGLSSTIKLIVVRSKFEKFLQQLPSRFPDDLPARTADEGYELFSGLGLEERFRCRLVEDCRFQSAFHHKKFRDILATFQVTHQSDLLDLSHERILSLIDSLPEEGQSRRLFLSTVLLPGICQTATELIALAGEERELFRRVIARRLGPSRLGAVEELSQLHRLSQWDTSASTRDMVAMVDIFFRSCFQKIYEDLHLLAMDKEITIARRHRHPSATDEADDIEREYLEALYLYRLARDMRLAPKASSKSGRSRSPPWDRSSRANPEERSRTLVEESPGLARIRAMQERYLEIFSQLYNRLKAEYHERDPLRQQLEAVTLENIEGKMEEFLQRNQRVQRYFDSVHWDRSLPDRGVEGSFGHTQAAVSSSSRVSAGADMTSTYAAVASTGGVQHDSRHFAPAPVPARAIYCSDDFYRYSQKPRPPNHPPPPPPPHQQQREQYSMNSRYAQYSQDSLSSSHSHSSHCSVHGAGTPNQTHYYRHGIRL